MGKSAKNALDASIPSEGQRALAAAMLERNAWFGGCRPETRESLLAHGQLRLLQKGEVLNLAGDPVEHLSLVVDGTLTVSTTTSTGKRHIVRYLEPGQLMHLVPVLDEQLALHDAAAHVPTLLLMMRRAQIHEALQTEPGLAMALMRLLCLRARLTFLELSQNTLKPLTQRCASALLHLAAPYGLPRDGGLEISLKLSQDEFADMVGCSRPVINRELKQLEAQGLIRMTYSHFVIVEPAALRRLADDS
ncbi:Crp/Fnr family transcriptional regulator [Variovorax robiniae]|uniref:Crp/Fnr family transcriptional regulator n=1 Tax=Variovorax robiniae TaxID=1836199 RepID=A0ABU8XE96_9BURK